MKMSDMKRQHPIMIPLGTIRGLIYIIPPLIIVLFQNIGAEDPRRLLIIYLIIFGSFFFSLVYQVFNWYFYTYRYEDGYLHLKTGVITKKERSIKQERVQTVNIQRGLIQRLLGLASLQVQTAGAGGETEFSLTAIALDEAELIKDSLESKDEFAGGSKEQAEKNEAGLPADLQEFTISIPELFIAGATSGRFLVLFSVLAAVSSQLTVFLPDTFWETVVEQITSTALVTAVLAVLVLMFFSWLVSVVAFVIQYMNFTIRREGNSLQLTWGLIEQKQLNLKLHRLQSLVVQESLLRQPLGRSALVIDVAGGGSKEQSYVTMLFPLIKTSELNHFLSIILPEYRLPDNLTPLPRRALRRYIFRAMAPVVLLSIALQWLPYGWLALFLLPLSFFWGISRYRSGGIAIEDHQLTFKFRFINLYRVVMKRKNIQALQVSLNPFQRWQDLKTVRAWVLSSPEGKQFQVVDVESAEAKNVWSWYSRSHY
jgi:putative membrane protein